MNQDESKLQQACVKWLRYARPDLIIQATPNQGLRTVKNASRLKAEGMSAGWPDLQILGRGCQVFIEMKTSTGKLSPAQKEVHAKLEQTGYKVAVCRSLDEFMQTVNNYLR
jgi:hypothetical protein